MPTDEMNQEQDRQMVRQSSWREWLPSIGQIRAAAQLQLDRAIDGGLIEIAEPDQPATVDVGATGPVDADEEMDDVDGGIPDLDSSDSAPSAIDPSDLDNGISEIAPHVPLEALPATSMRQGMGLVFVVGLLAGLIPFLMDWYTATQIGTSVVLAGLSQQMATPEQFAQDLFPALTVWLDTVGTIAGLEPIAPGWIAAFLSALGNWISWPLNWLAAWIVYGLGVLVVAKLLGATTTLQRFYAGVSYAFVPLLLLGLTPFPCVGAIVSLVAAIWSLVIYVLAVRVVTGFDTLRAFVSVVAPALIGLLTGMLVFGAGIASILGLFW